MVHLLRECHFRNRSLFNLTQELLSFGATALALQLIPVVGLAFIFTSSCGAALWASDLERKGANKPFNSATVQSESRVEL